MPDGGQPYVLVLYYSRGGHTALLARHVARGVDSVEGICARLRTVPAISSAAEQSVDDIPQA